MSFLPQTTKDFLAGYFHQDWVDDHKTVEGVLEFVCSVESHELLVEVAQSLTEISSLGVRSGFFEDVCSVRPAGVGLSDQDLVDLIASHLSSAIDKRRLALARNEEYLTKAKMLNEYFARNMEGNTDPRRTGLDITARWLELLSEERPRKAKAESLLGDAVLAETLLDSAGSELKHYMSKWLLGLS